MERDVLVRIAVLPLEGIFLLDHWERKLERSKAGFDRGRPAVN
jgi:hypothetical protein